MTVLEKIVADKRREVEMLKESAPQALLEKKLEQAPAKRSIREALSKPDAFGIIAEVKKRSPSRGDINPGVDVSEVAKGYEEAGVSGISVLTDGPYFGGSSEDLISVRSAVGAPILRKEFIIDKYQVLESKIIGADFILLIARILSNEEIRDFSSYAKSLGLEVLLEVHRESELDKLDPNVDIVGINNRDLDTLQINLDLSFELYGKIPNDFLKISESGISRPETLRELKALGFNGFLIGENFMRQENPGLACREFIQSLSKY